MNREYYNSPKGLIYDAGTPFIKGLAKKINPTKWQGMNITQTMLEVFDNVFRVQIPPTIEKLQESCSPDLPWAEDHFQERIGEDPTNPGKTFKYWPYYQEKEYREGGKFTHTYQERFWPKFAGHLQFDGLGLKNRNDLRETENGGIRFELGDLNDVINHLIENPSSRQAYLPIWFPEDTGVLHGGRVPCTLGYLFNIREGKLFCSYYLRSCDYTRHFKNDVYLAGRLMQHVVKRLQMAKLDVEVGILKMDIDSFHIFETDLYEIKKRLR